MEAAQNNTNAHDDDCATGLGGGVLDVIHMNRGFVGVTIHLTLHRPLPRITGPDNPVQLIGPSSSATSLTIDGGFTA